jgi:pimeloyl-ACP methyl ester carboxylesterase
VLVVSGELDDVTTPSEGRTVAGFFADSRQYIVPNAGHVDALYYPNGLASERIRRFLGRVLGISGPG